jgi:hypothetical protein
MAARTPTVCLALALVAALVVCYAAPASAQVARTCTTARNYAGQCPALCNCVAPPGAPSQTGVTNEACLSICQACQAEITTNGCPADDSLPGPCAIVSQGTGNAEADAKLNSCIDQVAGRRRA